MRPLRQAGVHEDRGLLWTRNRVPGRTVYGERLRQSHGTEYRQWNPRRSKLAALLRRDPAAPWLDARGDVLYLGAASGTTVSHVSDIVAEGCAVYAVESSPRSARDLLWNVEPRSNVVPIVEDAFHPERYAPCITRGVANIVQDVAQRHQVDILLRNLPFLAPRGRAFLFIKARSIHVSEPPAKVYSAVAARLADAGLRVLKKVELDPFEKDHCAFVLERS